VFLQLRRRQKASQTPQSTQKKGSKSIIAERTKEKRSSSCKSSQTDGEKAAHFATLKDNNTKDQQEAECT
jgi:hypothetical protein